MIEYINTRCRQWAIWRDRRENAGLGYPRACAFTKIPSGGASGYRTSIDEIEWETHEAIGSLENDLRAVVEVFYCSVGTAEIKAAALGMSKDTLYVRVHQAHVRVMEYFNDAAAGLHASNRSPAAAGVGLLEAKVKGDKGEEAA